MEFHLEGDWSVDGRGHHERWGVSEILLECHPLADGGWVAEVGKPFYGCPIPERVIVNDTNPMTAREACVAMYCNYLSTGNLLSTFPPKCSEVPDGICIQDHYL